MSVDYEKAYREAWSDVVDDYSGYCKVTSDPEAIRRRMSDVICSNGAPDCVKAAPFWSSIDADVMSSEIGDSTGAIDVTNTLNASIVIAALSSHVAIVKHHGLADVYFIIDGLMREVARDVRVSDATESARLFFDLSADDDGMQKFMQNLIDHLSVDIDDLRRDYPEIDYPLGSHVPELSDWLKTEIARHVADKPVMDVVELRRRICRAAGVKADSKVSIFAALRDKCWVARPVTIDHHRVRVWQYDEELAQRKALANAILSM